MFNKEVLSLSVEAVVSSLRTEDNLMGFSSDVKVGDKYNIYPQTLTEVQAFNLDKNIEHKKLVVFAAKNEKGHEGFIPVDCIEWLGKEKAIKELGKVH